MIRSMLMAPKPAHEAAERANPVAKLLGAFVRHSGVRRLGALAVFLTFALSLGACQGQGYVEETVTKLEGLGEEIIAAVGTEGSAEGIAKAQELFDARRGELVVRVNQLEEMGDGQLLEMEGARVLDAEGKPVVDDKGKPKEDRYLDIIDRRRAAAAARVAKLNNDLQGKLGGKEGGGAALDKLVSDYVSLVTLTKNPPEWETLTAWSTLPPASTFADGVDTVYVFIVILSVFFFALIMGVMFWFMWKYRRLSEDQKTSSISHNGKIEFLWSAIPTVLLLVIFVWGEVDFLKQTVPPPDAIQVRVTGRQWFWTVEYPDYPGVQLTSSVDESEVTMMVPLGKPVQLTMTSEDVIHSFFIPAFRVKRDVVPGRYTNIWFEATQVGTFNLYCTEYCGDQHSAMIGTVKVLEPDLFEAALAEAGKLEQGEGESLQAFGQRIYKRRGCNACHSLDGSPKTGPSWKGVWGKQETTDKGTVTVDDDYIRESVLEPNAQIVNGFNGVKMPSYKGQLDDKHITALIEFIKTLK